MCDTGHAAGGYISVLLRLQRGGGGGGWYTNFFDIISFWLLARQNV